MDLQRAYRMLLRLYPAGFKTQFGGEMAAVFAQATEQHRRQGRLALTRFAAREFWGVVVGATREWLSWPISRPATEDLAFPSDIAGAEKYLEIVSKRLLTAIANHDFPSARYYDQQDRKARALLVHLRSQQPESN